MKEELLKQWQLYLEYLETEKGMKYADQQEPYLTLSLFMEWLDKGYISIGW